MIGLSYGGKSLGKSSRTGSIKIQRIQSGGIKAVTQSAKGLQEIFIRTDSGSEKVISDRIKELL